MTFSPDELETCLNVLQAVADDPSVIGGHDRFKALVAKIHRRGKKGARQAVRHHREHADRELARRTGVVQWQADLPQLPAPTEHSTYHRPRRCYTCKRPFVEVHFFYHLLCPECAALNWERRHQRADLTGRIALVTGGRIKIGHETALKLLRDGARVLVTTRFPADAESRFRTQPDFDHWADRLEVHGLDLRDVPSVESFARHVLQREPYLDVLVHNAAQTVKRPLAFYRHLLPAPTATALLEARVGDRGLPPGTE